ncbi:LacI family DNA-binding transcriptional regulator [Alkalicoccobacillus porphyridii]|uniref:Substrate-binding domain-containing protein n=1 Tax=Alkalicoccobacillus porphyridii TaxID=2597270 RepID=A0A554A148_9BACI|nr:LacI family DNA-binding transcriptional regulator [Alkalicoccobacillus porphyridii]TSB47421.1 substrate-binding domain-containing protein [Alkalicoccobacillus porphyridii]
MKKYVTAIDVAKLAGVSQSSVSRVFGSGANVSKENYERVMAAANELGYRPNAIARGLITQKTNMIGIIMRDIKNPFYPEVLERFSQKLSKEGYHLIFISAKNEEVNEDELHRLLDYKVDGVIITDATPTSDALQPFLTSEVPVVLFNRYIDTPSTNSVCCNNYQAGFEIGSYLTGRGYEDLAIISGPMETSTAMDRLKGLKDCIQTLSATITHEKQGNYTYEGGFQATMDLLEGGCPQVIICGNDIMAFGAMDAIRQKGLKVPEDVSVIGFDNVSMASWPAYELTTWSQPMDQMVNAAVELLVKEIEGNQIEPARLSFDGQLIERKTVG